MTIRTIHRTIHYAENTAMKGVDSQHTTFVGEIIRDAVF